VWPHKGISPAAVGWDGALHVHARLGPPARTAERPLSARCIASIHTRVRWPGVRCSGADAGAAPCADLAAVATEDAGASRLIERIVELVLLPSSAHGSVPTAARYSQNCGAGCGNQLEALPWAERATSRSASTRPCPRRRRVAASTLSGRPKRESLRCHSPHSTRTLPRRFRRARRAALSDGESSLARGSCRAGLS
jgi:hypothetical protein